MFVLGSVLHNLNVYHFVTIPRTLGSTLNTLLVRKALPVPVVAATSCISSRPPSTAFAAAERSLSSQQTSPRLQAALVVPRRFPVHVKRRKKVRTALNFPQYPRRGEPLWQEFVSLPPPALPSPGSGGRCLRGVKPPVLLGAVWGSNFPRGPLPWEENSAEVPWGVPVPLRPALTGPLRHLVPEARRRGRGGLWGGSWRQVGPARRGGSCAPSGVVRGSVGLWGTVWDCMGLWGDRDRDRRRGSEAEQVRERGAWGSHGSGRRGAHGRTFLLLFFFPSWGWAPEERETALKSRVCWRAACGDPAVNYRTGN